MYYLTDFAVELYLQQYVGRTEMFWHATRDPVDTRRKPHRKQPFCTTCRNRGPKEASPTTSDPVCSYRQSCP